MPRSGHSLSEYGLVASLVAVLAIPALVGMGGNVGTIFSDMLKTRAPLKPQVIATQSQSTASSNTSTNTQVTLTLQSGKTISLPNYPTAPLASTVATSGANGATKVLANTMDSLISQLKEAGEVNSVEYNALVDLANYGHKMAEYARLLEQTALNSDSKKEYFATTVIFDGQAYLMKDLENIGGYKAPPSYNGVKCDVETGVAYTTLPDDPFNPPYGMDSLLTGFFDLYDKAEMLGAMSDPTVKKVVRSLVGEIALINEAVDISQGDVYMENTQPKDFTKKASSTLTDEKSTGICAAGNGKDSGVQCSG